MPNRDLPAEHFTITVGVTAACPGCTVKKWQHTFGQTSDEETPNTYRPRPFSRSYVVHLEDWYAQSHPDEDFAETFAVWLTPGDDWRNNMQTGAHWRN